MARETVFSEFELDKMSVKFTDDVSFTEMNCVGTFEEEMNVKIITKKCRGVVAKTRTRGEGSGVIKVSAHIPYPIFLKAYGLKNTDFKSGVYSYGQNSRHKEFITVVHINDEDGEGKYKAYPKCIIQTGVARKIENGADEVAEVELEIAIMPDDYSESFYECVDADTDDSVTDTWMTNWSRSLVLSNTPTTLYTITATLTKCKFENPATQIVSGQNFVTYIKADSGYELPATITINDGSALTAGTDYIYDDTTGFLAVIGIDANTTITVTATAIA